MGKIISTFNGDVQIHELNETQELQDSKELLGKCGNGFKASEAYSNSNGSSATPTITIKERTIWVYHGRQGGGSITGTILRGTGGEYGFSKDGKYDVEPGTYTHYINGYIYNDGWIASGICYK